MTEGNKCSHKLDILSVAVLLYNSHGKLKYLELHLFRRHIISLLAA